MSEGSETRLMEGYNAIFPDTIFHYTSFEKFKSILKYGTWRFKLSTQSNDVLDTAYIIDLIKNVTINRAISDDYVNLLEVLTGYFKSDEYKRSHLSYVSCFTGKKDSRLLWDAYTVNRPVVTDNAVGEYNGVCIGVNTSRLGGLLQRGVPGCCDAGHLAPVHYSPVQQIQVFDFLCKTALETFDSLKDEEDQAQDLVPKIQFAYALELGDYVTKPFSFEFNLKKSFVRTMFSFIEIVETMAPFMKHQFWEEEEEFRAAFSIHSSKAPQDGFIDLRITEDLFDYVILGPTFSGKEVEEISKLENAKLSYSRITTRKSLGTGIIRMS